MAKKDVDIQPGELKILVSTLDDFILENGVLYRVNYQARFQERCKAEKCSLQLVLPKVLRNDIIKELHSDVHFSYQKVWYKVKEKYWWPQMFKDIKDFCSSCIPCQQAKGHQKRPPLIPIESQYPWQIVGVDITEPRRISKNGNRYILVFVDLFTKYVVAKAIPNMTAETVANVFFQEIVCRYGAPEKLLSDRGQQFMSSLMQFTREIFSVQGLFTAAWNPRCDGMTERSNQTIVRCLSFLVNSQHDDWDERLPAAVYAYNTTLCFRSTDYTPYYLIFGRHSMGPADLQLVIPQNTPNHVQDYVTHLVNNLDEAADMARENISRHQDEMKEYFNKSVHSTCLQEGDKVFLYVPVTPKHLSRKLRYPWCGGYVIQRFVGPNTVKLRKLSDGKILKAPINVKRLKKCIDPKELPANLPVNDIFPALDDLSDDDIPVENFAPFMANPTNSGNPPDSSDDDQNTAVSPSSQSTYFVVEKVQSMRKIKGKMQYKVCWKGYVPKRDCWVGEEALNDTLREFIKSNPPPTKRRQRTK